MTKHIIPALAALGAALMFTACGDDNSGNKSTTAKDIFYFVATDDSNETALWKSDGTSAGTVSVKTAAAMNGVDTNPIGTLFCNGDTLYFPLKDADSVKWNLWKSTGSAASTVMLKEINASSTMGRFTPVGDTLYFTAADSTSGNELWSTDGTASGTALFKDINSGPGNSIIGEFAAFGGALYVPATSDSINFGIWKTNEAGNDLESIFTDRYYLGLMSTGSRLVFSGSEAGVYSLYTSDGTEANTTVVAAAGSYTSYTAPDYFYKAGEKVFFATDGSSALWVTDGTEEGTVELNSSITEIDNQMGVGERLFFTANDGTDVELWVSDGNAGGTVRVTDLNLTDYQSLGAVGDQLYFKATDATYGSELWVSDGTAAGTRMVKDIATGDSSPGFVAVMNGVFYFKARDDEHGMELWKTDGTESGTVMVKDIYPGTLSGL